MGWQLKLAFSVLFLATTCWPLTHSVPIVKRATNNDLSSVEIAPDPVVSQEKEEAGSDPNGRDKRKVDAVVGVKNAVLGFVFNKINSFIDQKTAWIDHLDRSNIAKNKAHGIEPPKDPVLSLSNIISGVIGNKLQSAAPLINIVTGKLAGGSSAGPHGGGGSGGFNIFSLLSSSSGGGLGGGGAEHDDGVVGANGFGGGGVGGGFSFGPDENGLGGGGVPPAHAAYGEAHY